MCTLWEFKDGEGGEEVIVKYTKEIYIPSGVYCTECENLTIPQGDLPYCAEFNRTVFKANDNSSKYIKCDECLKVYAESLRKRG